MHAYMFEQIISIDRMEQAVELFGSFDENVRQIENFQERYIKKEDESIEEEIQKPIPKVERDDEDDDDDIPQFNFESDSDDDDDEE